MQICKGFEKIFLLAITTFHHNYKEDNVVIH